MSACVNCSTSSRLDGVSRPDTGVAVGLELGPHREALRPRLVAAAQLVEEAELILDVMAVLVRDHVGLHERRAADAEAGLQVVEEPEVDVDELVAWTVERADLRVGGAAPRIRLTREEDRVRVCVLAVAPLEHSVPELLHAVDDRDDAAVRPLVRVLPRLAVLVDVARRVIDPDPLIGERRELRREPGTTAAVRENGDEDVDDQPDEAEPAAADCDAAGAHAAATGIADLPCVEGSVAAKAHVRLSCLPRASANSVGRSVFASSRIARWYHRPRRGGGSV